MAQSTATREPILASWKISEVLQRYPELLDVLVDLSPAFRLLRNPVLRRIQSRLATVAQAAHIAGLDPAALAQSLNAAIGLAAPHEEPEGHPALQAEAASPQWLESAPIVAELDVRPYQHRGEEPFSAIMTAATGVGVGQAMRLRNTFEPVPLYRVLGKRGFVHRSRRLGPDDWEVIFFRASGEPAATTASEAPAAVTEAAPCCTPSEPAIDWDRPAATLTIDVGELVPPEPMVRILESLEQLRPGEALLVHHVRRPIYLYPRLDALGYAHETREPGPDRVEILIRKPVGNH